MKKMIAEFIGTMTLVLLGCGAAVIAGDKVGFLGIAFAFGLSIVAMAYGIGPISGCHINPAVTLGVWASGRMSISEAGKYIISQIAGAIVGAILLMLIAKEPGSLGSNMIQDGYTLGKVAIFEIVFTAIFLITILGVTQEGSPTGFAGLAIGLTLTAIHIVGIPTGGVSVNPARSIGPALISMDATALSQLWIFIVFPIVGALIAGYLFRSRTLEAE